MILDDIRAEWRTMPAPTTKRLREFCFLIGGACILLALLKATSSLQTKLVLAGIGVILLAFGVFRPQHTVRLYRAWMGLGIVLGWFTGRAILILLYTIVLIPIGLVLRVFGKDLLHMRIEPSRSTYWLPPEPTSTGSDVREKYTRLFS